MSLLTLGVGSFGNFLPTLPGLVLWLRSDMGLTMNGSGVSAWADQSGSGNHALQNTANQQPTVLTNAFKNRAAISFNGNGDNLATGNFAVPLTDSTVFIVYADNGANASLGRFVIDGANMLYYVSHSNTDKTKFYAGQTLEIDESYPSLMHFKSIRWQGTTSAIFINSVFQKLGNTSTGSETFDRFTVGATGGGTGAASSAIDVCEVIVYDTALSDADRVKVEKYLNDKYGFGIVFPPDPTLTTDLIAYWKFDEATGATRNDSVGTNHLTDNDGTIPQVVGKIINAAFTNGSPQYLSVASNPVLSFGDEPFTVAGWIYPTVVTGSPIFISKYSNASPGQFDMYLFGGELYFELYNNTSGTAYAQSGFALTANAWYFVAGVYDRDNGLVKLSINGAAFVTKVKTITPVATTGSLKFGQENNGDFAHTRFDGWGLWKRVLTLAEIQTLYNGGAGMDPV